MGVRGPRGGVSERCLLLNFDCPGDPIVVAKLLHPLLLLLARATEREMARIIECLKAENRILGSKLPRRITVTPAQRYRLATLGDARKIARKQTASNV